MPRPTALDLAADAEAGHNSGDMPGVVFELEWPLIGALSEISDWVDHQVRSTTRRRTAWLSRGGKSSLPLRNRARG